jgi:hypothetical protein
MAKWFFGVLSLLVAFGGFASADEPDFPLTRAKVGDWVVFKMDSGNAKMRMRQEVTEVTDKTVTIKSIVSYNDVEQPPVIKTEDKISKDDPAVEAKNRKEFKYIDTGKGQETLKINGKDYRCDWKSMTTTATVNGMEITTASTLWMSKDAPVYGLVKTETKSNGSVDVMELIDSGSKK